MSEVERKTEEERKMKYFVSREGEKKQESSTANGNESCIIAQLRVTGVIYSSMVCTKGQVIKLDKPTAGSSKKNAAIVGASSLHL